MITTLIAKFVGNTHIAYFISRTRKEVQFKKAAEITHIVYFLQ